MSCPERFIDEFPEAFHPDASPWKNRHAFDSKLKDSINNAAGYVQRSGKVIILGDAGVGKTALIQKFCNGIFDKKYKVTIGVDFEVQKYHICNTPFSLQIWDTAGNERFRTITRNYYRGAACVIIAFDLIEMKSLDNIQSWVTEARNFNNNTDFDLFLVGCKKDLVEDAVYKSQEHIAKKMAELIKAEFWPTSAKTGENVYSFFDRLACICFERTVLESEKRRNNTISIGDPLSGPTSVETHKIKKKCC